MRSLLFVPASSEHFFEKAAAGKADAIIIDLEDAVAPAVKDTARSACVQALQQLDWQEKTLLVRINGTDSAHCYRDLTTLAESCPRLDIIMLPMVEEARDLVFADMLLTQVEHAVGRATPLGLDGIVETPLGFERISEIAAATGRLEGLCFGAGDYAASMGMRPQPVGAADPAYAMAVAGERNYNDKWHYPAARLANACRAFSLQPRDSAYADFKDQEGFRAACHRAAALGYEGKLLIHPAQIAAANDSFTPTPEEAAWAARVLAAMKEAQEQGQGAVALDGQMVDLANIRLARRTLWKWEQAQGAHGEGPAHASPPRRETP